MTKMLLNIQTTHSLIILIPPTLANHELRASHGVLRIACLTTTGFASLHLASLFGSRFCRRTISKKIRSRSGNWTVCDKSNFGSWTGSVTCRCWCERDWQLLVMMSAPPHFWEVYFHLHRICYLLLQSRELVTLRRRRRGEVRRGCESHMWANMIPTERKVLTISLSLDSVANSSDLFTQSLLLIILLLHAIGQLRRIRTHVRIGRGG